MNPKWVLNILLNQTKFKQNKTRTCPQSKHYYIIVVLAGTVLAKQDIKRGNQPNSLEA
jgi:hypothetical protein